MRQPKGQSHNAPQRVLRTLRIDPDEGHILRTVNKKRSKEGLRQHRKRVLWVSTCDGIDDGDSHSHVADGRESDDERLCHRRVV